MHTWVEIDSKAIKHNLKQFRKLVGPDVLLMPVIKANAYGHGFFEVAEICQQSDEVDRICVVSSDEALRLITNGDNVKPIQILSFYDLDAKILLKLAKNNIIFPLYDEKQAKLLNKVGDRLKKKIKMHLKIDVGTSRIGILSKDVEEFIIKIKKYKYIELEGVFSHFSSSEESREVTEQQLEIFNGLLNKLKGQGIDPPIKHLTCSAATILYPQSHFNAVRIGLSLYGLYPSDQTERKIKSSSSADKLKPALSWHTKIIQVKQIPSGSKISYDGTHTINRPTKLAILPVGYWDGFDRKLSNRGQVLIKGVKCPVLGRVCMNLTMVDVTNVLDVKAGDKVTLIGKQKTKEITAEDIAKWAGTINYEVVDRINPLITRIEKNT